MTSTPVNTDPEKANGVNFAQADQSLHHPHVARAKERLRHFLHPDGKKIHVANSPGEAELLRRQLGEIHNDAEFDVCISGSPEHLDALRLAQDHHETQRDELRMLHPDIFHRFEEVHHQLDALSDELDRVTTHGVALEAHFSKFGYDAHIRSYDSEDSPTGSGTTTPRSRQSSSTDKGSSVGERGYATPLKLFKVPVLRQYFYKGTLWRASRSEEVQSFELFIDLLYVGIVAIQGDAAAEHPTGFSLLRFVITFTLSWKIWNDMALIISWFETDDIFQRVSILFLLACLFGYTTNITKSFDGTYATLIGFYLTARLFMSSYLVLVAILLPMVRNIMIWYLSVAIVGGAIWVGSIHVSYPNQLILIWIALIIDLFGQMAYLFALMLGEKFSPRLNDLMNRIFEYQPAINIEHRTERMNAFVTLVFGYSVVASIYQSTVNGIDAHYGKGVLALVQAYCFNWMYFEIDGSNLHLHAIRRRKWSSLLWTIAHVPFIMAFVLGSGSMSRLVFAVDTPDSRLDALTEQSKRRADKEIPMGIRWFYCAGFGISLFFMGIISICHVHQEMELLRLKKRWRLCGRFVVAIIFICLPLATGLDSLELVGTMTALLVFCLTLELWAASCWKEKLCQRSRPCKYFGHCGKKDLEQLIKSGRQVDFKQLGNEKHHGLAYACPS